MRYLATLSCLISLLCAGSAIAEEIQAGAEYIGPKHLSIEKIGVSFDLPAGWKGGLPQGEDTFLIARDGIEGYIFITAEQTTVAQAQAALSQPLPVAPLVMTPKGAPTVSGSHITNDYTVTGGVTPLEGRATAKIGSTGWGVMVLAVSTSTDLPVFTKAAAEIVRSVKIVKPKVPKVVPGTTGGHWGAMLAGKRVVRFFHGSGYSEQQQFLMCPDGRFAYSLEGGGFNLDGASGAFQSKQGGKWSATGTPAGGTLTLNYNDGRSAVYQLSEQDGKLMLDGQRWLREAINCP